MLFYDGANAILKPGSAKLMQTVQFPCSCCGNTMEVDGELLGRQVSCPHCQQVVTAPANAPALEEFQPTESMSAFDGSSQPAEIAPESSELESPVPTIEPAAETMQQRVAIRTRQESLTTVYLLAFLIPYSVLVTAAAVWFYYKSQQILHPFEMLPDWPRDNEPPARQSTAFPRIDDAQPMPERLRVGLGGTIVIGDLEVKPLSVVQRAVIFQYDGGQRPPEGSGADALVMTMKLRNLSRTVTFAPNDRFFNRQWKKGMPDSQRPYTCLEVDGRRFYGGPCPWKPRRQGKQDDPAQKEVEGSGCQAALKPGEARTIIVCSDPGDPAILNDLKDAKSALVWRVQLRRGLVQVDKRETTATAVIGVVFTNADVETQ